MLYWSFNDFLSILIIALYCLSVYLAFSLTRVTRGAPAAWYVIIAALVLLLVRRAVTLYYDVQSQTPLFMTEETVLSFFVAVLFAAGLLMLLNSFKRQLKASEANQATI